MTLRNRCRKLVFLYHRPYRRILCRFSRLIRLLGSWTVMTSTVVKNRNKLPTSLLCPSYFRLRNDLYCVEWDVKLYSLTHSIHINRLTLHIRLKTPGNWQKVDSQNVDILTRNGIRNFPDCTGVKVNVVFCFYCLKARSRGLFLQCKKQFEPTFVEGGFRDWKNATASFEKRSESACHREAVAACAGLPGPGVDTLLSVHCERQQATSWDALSTIISSITYLTR